MRITNVVDIVGIPMSKRKGFERHGPTPHPATQPVGPRRPSGGAYWLYGRHASAAALANPRRHVRRLLWTAEAASTLGDGLAAARAGGRLEIAPEPIERGVLDRLLPGAVHQGVALEVRSLPDLDLDEFADGLGARERAVAVVLDRVTDPQNVGAVLRSAAAFGADAVIVTERHATPETGALAKAASGALDHVPLIRVANLARALARLKESGFWCIGLAREAERTLAQARPSGRVALVLGSEGAGLRRLTRDRCDMLVRLPTAGPIDQLNVSNAAAVALYELARDQADMPAEKRDG